MIMFEKFGQHQPLNRQPERYALEGVPIALSTMADAVGGLGQYGRSAPAEPGGSPCHGGRASSR